jgi:prevent-host-death family protein
MVQRMVHCRGVRELGMNITVSDAKAQLTDLVRRAEAGEEIVLTRFGAPVARIAAVRKRLTPEERLEVMDRAMALPGELLPGPDAAHCSDFLFDDKTGLPT